MPLETKIRNRHDDDESFLFSSFLRSLEASYTKKFLPQYAERRPPRLWYTIYSAQLQDILNRASTSTWVICPTRDESTIISWIAASQDQLYYVYCKSTFAQMGHATKLFEHAKEQLNWEHKVFCPYVTAMGYAAIQCYNKKNTGLKLVC